MCKIYDRKCDSSQNLDFRLEKIMIGLEPLSNSYCYVFPCLGNLTLLLVLGLLSPELKVRVEPKFYICHQNREYLSMNALVLVNCWRLNYFWRKYSLFPLGLLETLEDTAINTREHLKKFQPIQFYLKQNIVSLPHTLSATTIK